VPLNVRFAGTLRFRPTAQNTQNKGDGMRTFFYKTSFHRPDGLATIWIHAERSFSFREIFAKMENSLVHLSTVVPNVIISIGYTLEAHLVNPERIQVIVNPWQMEILCDKTKVNQILKELQNLWKGEWKEDEEVWETWNPDASRKEDC